MHSVESCRHARFTPAGFSVTVAVCLGGRTTNLGYFLRGLLTGHGNAITGGVGLAQFLPTSRDPRSQNI
jgi:hypothetical protein